MLTPPLNRALERPGPLAESSAKLIPPGAGQRPPAPPVYRPMPGTTQAKPSAVLIVGQRPPAPPVYRPQAPSVQGKVGSGSVPAAKDWPASARFGVPPAIHPAVIQRNGDDDNDDDFTIPRAYRRPDAPTLGDWIRPVVHAHQREQTRIARLGRREDRREKRRTFLSVIHQRYDFHDLTPATPVLDSANLPRPTQPRPTQPLPSAAIPAAVPVTAIAALPAPPAPLPVPPAALPAALPAPPAGTPYQRLSNICNEHFLLKHTAKDKAGAVASGQYYGGTVTVISRNPTNVAALEAVVGRRRAIVLVTGWVVRNGLCSSSSGPMKVAVFGPAPFDHLDFST
jgi:hypothetical protein